MLLGSAPEIPAHLFPPLVYQAQRSHPEELGDFKHRDLKSSNKRSLPEQLRSWLWPLQNNGHCSREGRASGKASEENQDHLFAPPQPSCLTLAKSLSLCGRHILREDNTAARLLREQ